jgi:hypothetical protein
MTPQETEKIKLMQLFKQGKIDNLPDVDSDAYKASKVKDMMSKAEGVDEAGGILNITDPSNPKLTSMEALITNAITQAYPSADINDVREFYKMLMDDVKAGRVELMGLDLGEEFEQFADANNVILKDPSGGIQEETPKSNAEMTDDERENFYLDLDDVNEETVDEGVKWMKRFSGVK